MLVQLELSNALCAGELLALQRAAYVSEAELVRSLSLPPLQESLPELMDCGETVLGWRENGDLLAAIGYESSMYQIVVARLCVAPEHRRRGLASKLINAVIVDAGPRTLFVTTAKANMPALGLYHKLGFHLKEESMTTDGLPLLTLQRLSERTKQSHQGEMRTG